MPFFGVGRAALPVPLPMRGPLPLPPACVPLQTFLNKTEVTDRVLAVVKNFEKVDPAKVRAGPACLAALLHARRPLLCNHCSSCYSGARCV